MGERKRPAGNAVVRHQNPARQALVKRTARIGDGGMSGLHHEGLDVFEQQAVQGLAFFHGSAKRARLKCAGRRLRPANKSSWAKNRRRAG